jgi:hypothetical protein
MTDDSANSFINDPELWRIVNMSNVKSPQLHKIDLAKDTKTWMIPIFKQGNHFIVWTGDNAVRYFSEDNLPDELRVPLGMIMNCTKAAELNQKEVSDMDMSKGISVDQVFAPGGFPKEFEDIGWQHNKYYYVVVLTDDELAIVRSGGKTP